MEYADRVDRIELSAIREAFNAAGEDAINLGIGQPDFDTPENVKQAAIDAIERGDASGYTANHGIDELRRAVAESLNFDASPDQVLVTAGGSEALHLSLETYVNPGDEVIFPDPGFVSYDALTKVAGGEPVPVPLNEELRLEPETVKEAVTDDTAAIIVNSPSNPTGSVQTREEMKAFAEIADDNDVMLISDEVYHKLIYEGEHHSPAEFGDNVVTIDAVSKTYSMTGWRLGYVIAEEETVGKMIKVHQYIQACATAASQYAALEALTGPQDAPDRMKEEFEARRDILLEGLDEIGLEYPNPRGAFYA
ncbi:MAG: pyridoxal phosphate-dependent aminotransferase, partial [Halobacteria archaeon]|nr:pyridoxal phosphate-dependent aminotransferase [Halobacteria archaeon]